MDILDDVRELRSDVNGPTPEETAEAQARLDQAIAAEYRSRQAPSRRRLSWAGGLVAAAAIAAAALVVTSVAGIGPLSKPASHFSGGISPANAEEVLNGAAKHASASAPSPAPGQYLRVESDTAWLRTAGPGTYGQFRRGSTASWISHSTQVIYVPADRTGVWIEVDNATPATTSDEHGTDVAAAIAQAKNTDPKDAYTESVQYLPGGLRPVVGTPDNRTDSLGVPAGANVAPSSVPTDPAALLAFYRQQLAPAGYGNPTAPDIIAFDNEMAFNQIAGDLNSNLLPASFRAAAFKAIGLIPGVKLLDTTGTSSTVQLVGHHDDYRLTINDKTGLVTNVENFVNEPDGEIQTIGAVPAGTPNLSTTVKTTVVDKLPASLQAGLKKADK